MNTRGLVIAGGAVIVASLAVAMVSRSNAQGLNIASPADFLTFTPENNIIAPVAVTQPFAVPIAGGLNRSQVFTLIDQIDASQYGGWFRAGGRNHNIVAAIWKRESNWNKNPFNPNDPSGAYGIGQVLGTTAAQFGVHDPNTLFDPRVGGRVSMQYMRWSWDELTRRLGREPSINQWISAYNAGARGVAEGRTVSGYLGAVLTRAQSLIT